ncbi:MAG: recombination mediator RecR [Patescibacteria group bacterium]
MKITPSLEKLTEAFERLPGIGPKSAARLAFYLLRVPDRERQMLGQAVLELGEKTKLCERCFNIMEISSVQEHFCLICADGERNPAVVLVVEEPLDLLSFERMGKYKGLYHVLHGAISPLEHVGPENLRIRELLSRLKIEPVEEVIMATNPSLEGEATAMYLKKLMVEQLPQKNLKITRLASGIPTGGDLEYADALTLSKALEGRQDY